MVLESLAMIDALGRPFFVAIPDESRLTVLGHPQWCSLILLRDPQSSLKVDASGTWITGPRVLCWGPSRTPHSPVTRGDLIVVQFHPGEINEVFFDHSVFEVPVPRSAVNDYYLLEPFLADTRAQNGLLLGASQVSRLNDLFAALKSELSQKQDGYWPCRTRSYLLELLIQVRHLKQEELPPTLAQRLETHLHGNYGQPLRIEDLSTMLGTNRTTLSSQFKAYSGTTIVTFVNRLRMQVAATLLRDTTLPIAEIIHRIGVNDLSRFGRLFKAHWGVTPGEYRRQENWIFPHFRSP